MPGDLLAKILRGESTAALVSQSSPAALCDDAREEGVLPIVADVLGGRGDIPAALRAALRTEASRLAAIDLIQERELYELIAALDGAQAGAILMKGAQLAYTHYRRPDLRTRVDTDILIPDRARERVREVLATLGYAHTGHVSGPKVMSQACYVKRRGQVAIHTVDVHWRLANPHLFAETFSYDELAAASQPVLPLGPAARGLSDVHALLLACVHRVAHHFDSERLIWLYDIHLIASRLEEVAWTEFAKLAVDRGVASICLRGLQRTCGVLDTPVPPAVLLALEARSREAKEASATYMTPSARDRPDVHVLTSDLRALPTWTDRWRLLHDHMFPSAAYMRDVYAPSSRAPLSVLYATRALRGARRWLVRT
jgi:Uncharacterised nucleotidyltransferase